MTEPSKASDLWDEIYASTQEQGIGYIQSALDAARDAALEEAMVAVHSAEPTETDILNAIRSLKGTKP